MSMRYVARWGACASIAVLSLAQAAIADDVRVSLSTGFDYSSGKYGGLTTTTVWYAPISLQLQSGNFRARVTAGWLEIDGDGIIAGANDGPIILPGSGTVNHTQGLSDTTIQLRYLVTPGGDFPGVELIGKVKLPTADESKGLGTGETDYAAQVDLFQTFDDLTLFASGGYRVFGDPVGTDLDDVPYASAGLSLKTSPAWSFGSSIDWRAASSPGSDPKLEVTPFVKARLTGDLSLNAYAVVGLSDGSPDWGSGLSIKWSP